MLIYSVKQRDTKQHVNANKKMYGEGVIGLISLAHTQVTVFVT
jgi:hypothetical protein